MLTDLNFSDPFSRPHPIDPFANSPSTTTLATFPSISSANSEPDSLRAVVGLSLDRSKPPSASASSSPYLSPPQSHSKSGSGASSHHHLFGRSASGKNYPRGDRDDDRDESVSLFPPHGADIEEEKEGEAETETEGEGEEFGEDLSKKSIRLVPSQNRF